MVKHTLKILRCLHHQIIKVFLALFQHYAQESWNIYLSEIVEIHEKEAATEGVLLKKVFLKTLCLKTGAFQKLVIK